MSNSDMKESSVVVPAAASPMDPKPKTPKKDPSAPNKNLTSYLLFSNYIRPIIKERTPGIVFAELSKQMGLEFRQLSTEGREFWNERAKEDKARYESAMKEYRKTNGREVKVKKGKSSYNLYFQAMINKMKTDHPELTFGEISKRLGQGFKNLPEEERKSWEELAKIDRKRVREHNLELEAAAAVRHQQLLISNANPSSTENNNSQAPSSAAKPNKRSRGKVNVDPNAPRKNLTAYIHFCNAMRSALKEQYPEATLCELGRVMGKEFKKLSELDRKVYDDIAAVDKKRYVDAIAEHESKINIERDEATLLSLFKAKPPNDVAIMPDDNDSRSHMDGSYTESYSALMKRPRME